MPLINDDSLFPISSFVAGCTTLGSAANGQTVQFDLVAIIEAIKLETDVLHFINATKVGQTVVGNSLPGTPDSPGINSGKKWIGEITTFPATTNSHIGFIYRLL